MFDFARPDLKVYALPLLALLVLAMAWSRALPSWGRRVVSCALRSAVLILCLLALALPEVQRDIQEEKALILLIDVSESLPRAERERAVAEAREVLDTLRKRAHRAPPRAHDPSPSTRSEPRPRATSARSTSRSPAMPPSDLLGRSRSLPTAY